jgi:ABC-type branched-subunit amino acid transport system ATPase component
LSFRSQAGENLTNVFLRWKTTQRQEAINQAQARLLLQGVGLADKAHCSAAHLSYGQQKLLTLVCCLAAKADLFLLDEPVAGIAPDMIERVLNIIRDLRYGGKSVILIEHNLDAVTRVCDRVVFMDAGTKVSEGSPQEVRNDPRVIKAYID